MSQIINPRLGDIRSVLDDTLDWGTSEGLARSESRVLGLLDSGKSLTPADLAGLAEYYAIETVYLRADLPMVQCRTVARLKGRYFRFEWVQCLGNRTFDEYTEQPVEVRPAPFPLVMQAGCRWLETGSAVDLRGMAERVLACADGGYEADAWLLRDLLECGFVVQESMRREESGPDWIVESVIRLSPGQEDPREPCDGSRYFRIVWLSPSCPPSLEYACIEEQLLTETEAPSAP